MFLSVSTGDRDWKHAEHPYPFFSWLKFLKIFSPTFALLFHRRELKTCAQVWVDSLEDLACPGKVWLGKLIEP